MPEHFTSTRGRRWTILALALTGTIAALAALAPAGRADFTTDKCQGTAISGRGASFQNAAQTNWISEFQNNFCADVGTFPNVTYTGSGSGSGLQVMGRRSGACPCPPGNADGSQSRNQPERYAASDDPPPPSVVSDINKGTDTVGDEGIIHVIPAAVGSVAIAVNFPNNCDRSLLPDANETDPAAANGSPFDDRVRFTRSQFEHIMAGDAGFTNWTQVFPTLGSDADCNIPITRVVRFDDSGTTFALKSYLDGINTGRGWKTTYITPDTRTWPAASLVSRADCGGATGPQGNAGSPLTSGCSNGNGALMDKLKLTDGSVGYSDVATARSKGLDIATTAIAGSRDDDVFWTQGQNPGNNWTEATADPAAFTTSGQHGANCVTATYSGIPSSTLGDWFNADATDSNTGAYVICTLTYELAWDDYKPPYSLQGCGTSCEEQKARSVKDYLSSIVSNGGQETLFPADYAPLPDNLLDIARTGVNAICWDKAGSGNCPVVRYAYPRPRGATPLRVSLVPAYSTCAAPNRTHGAPLAFPSCNPPTQSSGFLTVGSPDANGAAANSAGFALFKAIPGNSATPADEADVQVQVNILDVRNKAGLADYTGQVQLDSTVQITDRLNGTSGSQPGTGQSIPFPVTVGCTTTASASVGSTCSISTTFDAVVPGSVPEGKRSIWELGQVVVNDGGSDGLVSTGPNTVFERQGVFIP
jgi:ABC-type phosphate transport system substrate-binding protein